MTAQYSRVAPLAEEVQSYVFAQSIDIETHSSLTKYVGPLDPLNEPRYKPIDLVDLTDAAFLRVQ